MTDLEAARKAWLSDQPIYEQFGKELVSRLKAAIRREGIWAEVSSRAKDVDSLTRKLIKKPHYTYDSLGDKTGARVTVHYRDEINPILEIAARLFDCSEPEDKADTLKPDQVGYLSFHLDLRLWPGDPQAITYAPDKFRAELQVRTLAQHLWSEMSHDTFYKNDETTAQFHRPEELEAELAAAGFSVLETVGLEGPGWLFADFEQRWCDARRREDLLRIARALESEGSIRGLSAHLLAVARRLE